MRLFPESQLLLLTAVLLPVLSARARVLEWETRGIHLGPSHAIPDAAPKGFEA